MADSVLRYCVLCLTLALRQLCAFYAFTLRLLYDYPTLLNKTPDRVTPGQALSRLMVEYAAAGVSSNDGCSCASAMHCSVFDVRWPASSMYSGFKSIPIPCRPSRMATDQVPSLELVLVPSGLATGRQ